MSYWVFCIQMKFTVLFKMMKKKGDLIIPGGTIIRCPYSKIFSSLIPCMNVSCKIHHSLIGSYQVIYRSCFQDFANDKMDLQSSWKILAFPSGGDGSVLLLHSPPFFWSAFVICFFFAGDKYLTFPFSYLSPESFTTLRESQRCTGCLRQSVKAISSLISHLVANSPREYQMASLPH